MTLASILVPVLLIGLGVAAVVIFALIGFRKWWQMLDAEREAALAPPRLLREQAEVIADVIADASPYIRTDIRDKLMAAHEKYQEIERKRK